MSRNSPKLTESDVRDWTVDRYYERGEGYYHDDRIHRTRREGRTLRALCHGSRPDPYRVEVTLDDEGIAYGTCSCPIGESGRCKHAVALLLTWVHHPEDFDPVEPLNDRLRAQSKDTLISILQRLIDRDPAVEALVEMHLATPDGTEEEPVRSYVEQAFAGSRHDPYDSGYGRDVAENLDPLLDRGREHLEAQEWTTAVRLFRTVASTVCEQYESGYDEDGSIISVLNTCASELGTVLAETADQELRSQILEALLDLYLWNAEEGGFGAGSAAAEALRRHTTSEERQLAAEVLRAHLPPSPDTDKDGPSGRRRRVWDHDDWLRDTLGDLLLDLEQKRLDTEAYLDLCRETGHWDRLIDALLELDRFEEAAEEAVAHLPDYDLKEVADRLVDRGADDRARKLVKRRLDENGLSAKSMLTWLYEHAVGTDDYEAALDAARRLFDQRPSLTAYKRLRTAAEHLGQWSSIREELLRTLADSPYLDVLVNIHLHEGAHDRALEWVEPFAGEERSASFGVPFLRSVAESVADTHPEAAVALHDDCARELIAQRGRPNYAEAAEHLQQAHTICDRTDRLDEWQDRLDALYDDELYRLPAARDEFEKAGLL